MKKQIETLISLARMVADLHYNYNIKDEVVNHTHNIRVIQANERDNEFIVVVFTRNRLDFSVRFSNYSGVNLEFPFSANIEETLDPLIEEVSESLNEWQANSQEDIVQMKLDAVEKRRQTLIKLTNELNELEGKL
jgi:hypothetical protein